MCRTVEQLDVDVKEKQEKSKFISPFVSFTNRAKIERGRRGGWRMGEGIEGQEVTVRHVIILGYMRDSQTMYYSQFHLRFRTPAKGWNGNTP